MQLYKELDTHNSLRADRDLIANSRLMHDDPKAMEQQRAKAAEEFFTRDVKTPEAPPGKQNIDIQTLAY